MNNRKLIENFIQLLPLWHYKIERPIKRTQKHSQISYEAHVCLIALAKNGPLTMSQLAASLKLSKQQATQLIDKLYQAHLIQRSHDEKDRRIILITICDAGIQFLKENQIDPALAQAALSLSLSELEKQQLLQATEILLRLLPKLE